MLKKLSARATASIGMLLILAGLVGASFAPSGNVALASASESASLYGACGSVTTTTPGCGAGSCSQYCQIFSVAGDGNVTQSVGSCAYFSNSCGQYNKQVNCR